MVSAKLLLVAAFTTVTSAANCSGDGDGECVTYGLVCQNGGMGDVYGSYKPDCSGHCFQYDSFQAIEVHGNGAYGTDCVVYSDANCQNEIFDTENQLDGGNCHDTGIAMSMKCYFHYK